MHLPDGFLDAKTALLSGGAALAGVSLALREVRQSVPPRDMPLLGLAGAFVFAAQMLNFPVAGGTSGHLLGGVLTAVLLGPAAATLVLTCVLLVQCLMFSDGGLTALGANIFNMAIVAVWGGWFVFRLTRRALRMPEPRATIMAASFAAWTGTVASAASCAGQLALSGTVSWQLAFPSMAGIHMLIGIGEGLITGLILSALARRRPRMLERSANRFPSSRRALVMAVLIPLAMAAFIAPVACSWPDGLEKVAAQLGFEHRATTAAFPAPMPDYAAGFMKSAPMATAVAGLIGTVLAFLAAYVLARVLGRRRTPSPASPESDVTP